MSKQTEGRSAAAIVGLSAPWPITKIAVGMIHMGAANDTFYVRTKQ